MKFHMGELVRDLISGLEGYVVAECQYATGCTHYGIQPPGVNDKREPYEWQYIDETRLVRVADAPPIVFQERALPDVTSGPVPDPPCGAMPRPPQR